ncbi:MAG: AMP-binding protein, partial [Anaerolineae bacterium]|nr:AMP-binding protein [Anaerolineae bacterium]
ADPGWVTGTTYGITAPWAAGLSQVHFAGRFDPATWYTVLQDQGVTIWYTAPTALRMLMRKADVAPDSFDLTSLKRIYSVGEPLNPEVIHWALDHFHTNTYDTWFQTETGCVMIANRPGAQWKIGAMGLPVSGVEPAIITEAGAVAAPNETGRLMLKAGWASMFRTYLNHPDTYAARFTGDLYDTHDLAYVDADGYYWYIGRNDDVINTAGHLVSPFEVESALIETGDVTEAAVIGAPDPELYEKVVAFVSLREGIAWSKKLEVKIRVFVSNRVSTIAVPSDFIVMDDLPKNQSGKIMRRILRAQYAGEAPGDTSTLAQE